MIEKGKAEGIDVTNHMSTISAGLAETIREWFSEGKHETSVETTERVNLEEVRIEPAKTHEHITEESEQQEEIGQQPEAIEEPAQPISDFVQTHAQAVEEAHVEAEAEPQVVEHEVQRESVQEQTEVSPVSMTQEVHGEAAQAQVEEEEPEVAPEKTEAKSEAVKPVHHKPERVHHPKHKPVMVHHPKPQDVQPAGPQLTAPRPAQLSGPRIVRVESVEKPKPKLRPNAKPRPRPEPRTQSPIATEKLMPAMPDTFANKGKKVVKKKGKNEEAGSEDLGAPKKAVSKKFRLRDIEERQARLAAARGEILDRKPSRKIGGAAKKSGEDRKHDRPEKAYVSEPITVKSLAAAMGVKGSDIITKLFKQGVMASINQVMSASDAELMALEFGTELVIEHKKSLELQIQEEFEARDRNNLEKRTPVVTMLGHVDHGKTSLLDKIRSASVASGEAGGITQHIGAYQVDYKGKKVTFLDTPGHAAFTAMRARGANMTDIVILVVAADDGVMPQTVEAIHHAQAAGVPIVVALNKIDIQGVDINKIYGQLSEHNLVPAEWGGDTEIVKTSAHTGEGIDDLIDRVDTIAEIFEYKADSTIPATGWVVEAKMTTTQGVVATLLLKEGCLKTSDIILAGSGFGRIRSMKDSFGKKIKKATSSMPVEISGLSEVPSAGDRFYCLADLNKAKMAAEENMVAAREKSLSQRATVTLDNLFSRIEAGKLKELNLIIRADVQGSVDVLIKHLTDLSTDEIKVKILHAAVGGVTEGDVILAEASDAIIIGFNVVPEDQVKGLADSKGVDIRLYNIIYRITEDLRDAMVGMLEPIEQEKEVGKLLVRNTFKITGVGTVAGCLVQNGVVSRNSKIRLIRNNIVVKDNCVIDTLKHFKDDVKEVKAGYECGLKIANFDDVKQDDMFIAYEIVKVKREL